MILEEKLPNLDINNRSRLRNGLDSIYRIDTSDVSFKELLKKDVEIKDTRYIIYSNDNTSKKLLFLNKTGQVLKNDNICVNQLIYLPLGFDIDYSYASDNSEILKEYINYSTTLFGE